MSEKEKNKYSLMDNGWFVVPMALLFHFTVRRYVSPIFNEDSWGKGVAIVITLGIFVVAAYLLNFVYKSFGLERFKYYKSQTIGENSDYLANAAKNQPDELDVHHEEDMQTADYKASADGLENCYRYIGPLKSLELFFKNYADFSGRSSRSSFLWFQLLDLLVIITVLELVDVVLHNSNVGWFYQSDYGGFLSLSWWLITLVPNISLVVRRLHDTNHSGWWLLLSLTIIGIIPLIIWFCSSGNKGKNTYGPDKEAGL